MHGNRRKRNDAPNAAPDAHLRRAASSDAEAIARVQIETWQIAYRGQIPDSYLHSLSQEFDQRAERWRSRISDANSNVEIWVSASGSEVVGFAAFGPARDADPHTGEVYAIYVLPEYWDQGRGRALVQHATDRLASRGFEAAMLWVLESNQRARRFYEVAGWTLGGDVKIDSSHSGVELREVNYRKTLHPRREES